LVVRQPISLRRRRLPRRGAQPALSLARCRPRPAERIPLTQNRIVEIQQLPGGNISFAAEDPGLGIIAPDGKIIAYRGPDIVNFSRTAPGCTYRPTAR
jgi:hypothetical protein